MHGGVTAHDTMGAPPHSSNPSTTSRGMPAGARECKCALLKNGGVRFDAVLVGRGSRGATCF